MLDVVELHSVTQFASPLPVEYVKQEHTCVHAAMRVAPPLELSSAQAVNNIAAMIDARMPRTIAYLLREAKRAEPRPQSERNGSGQRNSGADATGTFAPGTTLSDAVSGSNIDKHADSIVPRYVDCFRCS